MLYVGGSSQDSAATPSDARSKIPAIVYLESSYDRSSNKSRGRKQFDKASYKDSFPIRATNADKMNSKARHDFESR